MIELAILVAVFVGGFFIGVVVGWGTV